MKRQEREAYINEVIEILRQQLAEMNIGLIFRAVPSIFIAFIIK